VPNPKPAPDSEPVQRNGSAGAAPSGEETASEEKSSVDRVEEIMDQAGHKVGALTSQLGQSLFRMLAHARETLEDCWAEAQSIRRGEKNDPPAA
jgi:hypothetical protein